MNDGYERGVSCPLCRRVLAPCQCGKPDEDGCGQVCDGCIWSTDECHKMDIVTSVMARNITAEHDVPEALADEIARTALGSVVWGDCDRYHHAILSGQFDLDRDRYTPRIDLSGEWDREPTPRDRAAVFAISLTKAGDEWRKNVPRECAVDPKRDVVWHKRVEIARAEGSPYWRVKAS